MERPCGDTLPSDAGGLGAAARVPLLRSPGNVSSIPPIGPTKASRCTIAQPMHASGTLARSRSWKRMAGPVGRRTISRSDVTIVIPHAAAGAPVLWSSSSCLRAFVGSQKSSSQRATTALSPWPPRSSCCWADRKCGRRRSSAPGGADPSTRVRVRAGSCPGGRFTRSVRLSPGPRLR